MALESMTMYYCTCDTCGQECRDKKQLVCRRETRGLKEYIVTLGWVVTTKKQRILCPACTTRERSENAKPDDLPQS